jgi:hypothetical protein
MLGAAALSEDSPAFVALRRVLVGEQQLGDGAWFAVAEQVRVCPAGLPRPSTQDTGEVRGAEG